MSVWERNGVQDGLRVGVQDGVRFILRIGSGSDGGIHGGIDGAIDGGKSFCSLKPNIEKIISPRDEVEWSWDQASRGFEASYALTHQPRPQGVVILRWKVEC